MPKCKSDYKLLSLELLELDEKVALLEDKIVELSSFLQKNRPTSGCLTIIPPERMKQLLINHRVRQDRSINLTKSPNTCPSCFTILLYSIHIILVLMTIYNFSNSCSSQRFGYLALKEP